MAGPSLDALISTPTTASTGLRARSAAPDTTTSIARLSMANHPPDGHEDLGGLQAGLDAPRVRPVAQSLQGPRMGIAAHLAAIAGHRLDLGLERRADIDPRVGDERPGVAPLGTARRVERVHGLHAALGGARGHQRRLEDQLVVAIDVAAVLAVHGSRPDVSDHLLDPLDHVELADRVEPLVGEAEQADVV